MEPRENPFAPGAGCSPPALVGRDKILDEADILFSRVKAGLAAKSMLLHGLRGVGKTVLLRRMENMAKEHGYHVISYETIEGISALPSMVQSLKRVLFDMEQVEKVKHALRVLGSFIKTVRIGGIELGVDVARGYADSGNREQDWIDVFVAVGEAARERKTGIALVMDEIHMLDRKDFGMLIMVMHKMQQLNLPIVMVAAGLPILMRLAGDAKTYAERLFSMHGIGHLNRDQSAEAITHPIREKGVDIDADALEYIYVNTQGYPYFLQEWGAKVWNTSIGPVIQRDDAIVAAAEVQECLDATFYRVRYERLTPKEREFMLGMAKVRGESISMTALAQALGTRVSSLSTTRERLIIKGMIYSPERGNIAYSVPMFGAFLRRIQG